MKELLANGAAELGISLTEKQLDDFIKYKELLQEWNQKMNLTAITEDREVITKHFIDCLTIVKAIDLSGDKTVVDVGTGAGFPGLVLKIAFPNLKITLVDSLNKRLNFLNEVISQLGLTDIVCKHGRAEDLGKDKDYREKFDMCASRAVANLATLSEYTLPFVKEGGYLIALKGQNVDEELETGKKAIKILGGNLEEIVETQVPFTDLNHKIVKVKKVKKTDKKYPGKAGEPSKNPLGTPKK